MQFSLRFPSSRIGRDPTSMEQLFFIDSGTMTLDSCAMRVQHRALFTQVHENSLDEGTKNHCYLTRKARETQTLRPAAIQYHLQCKSMLAQMELLVNDPQQQLLNGRSITTTSRKSDRSHDDQNMEFGTQEEDAMMDEMISKHRTELTELQKFIGRSVHHPDNDDDDDLMFPSDDHLPPPPPPLSDRDVGGGNDANESYDDLPSPDGYHTPRPVRSKTAERLMELSRTEEALRNDRMKLAELSDVRNERIGRDVIHRWNPEAKVVRTRNNRTLGHGDGRTSPTVRVRKITTTTSPRTSAKVLREYSKDFVQQALDFNGHDVDEDEDLHLDMHSPATRGLDASLELLSGGDDGGAFRGRSSQQELRTYVKQMEETIAQLVLQKDELLRNQAEFDKHASGIFPSLEHLNHQLSQIVQGKMANSQVNIKDDVYDEIRIQSEKLDELESETKRRNHDADVLEQKRQLEITQIKGQIVSLVTSGKLRDEKTELIADTVKKLQQELQEAVKGILHRYQLVDKRINQLQTPLVQPRFVVRV